MHLLLLSSILQKPLFITRKVNNLELLSITTEGWIKCTYHCSVEYSKSHFSSQEKSTTWSSSLFCKRKKKMQFIFLFPTVSTLGHKVSSKPLDGRKNIHGHSLSLQSMLNSLLLKMWKWETFLVVQWLRLCLPMQEVGVWSLCGELRSHMLWGCCQKLKNEINKNYLK